VKNVGAKSPLTRWRLSLATRLVSNEDGDIVDIDWNRVQRKSVEVFCIADFRPGQRELLEAVLHGNDAVGILPTGGGKSLCYQLASLFLNKAVVVVTPLISLADDQTEKLKALGVPAVRIDSTVTEGERRVALAGVASGKLDLVYVTPERLQNEAFLQTLAGPGVSLFVVEEAHCVSEWGHDFRPAYLGLREAARRLGRPPILALTATATRRVEEDIVAQLALRNPVRVRHGCERRNIHLSVVQVETEEQKRDRLVRLLAAERGSVIVYTTTIRAGEEIWTHLVQRDVAAGFYHGQLPASVRQATQHAFMDGRYRVLVATKAFGMGIDKGDTRLVVHAQLPESLESYFQELGRAGRDGAPARAVLLYLPADTRVLRFFLAQRYPSRGQIDRMISGLAARAVGDRVERPKHARGEGERKNRVLLWDLEQRGVVESSETGPVLRQVPDAERLKRELEQQYLHLREGDRARLDAMVRYTQLGTCRNAELLRYFGESPAPHCSHCDNCDAAGAPSVSGAEQVHKSA
jgi:ATP-dependent DNA helicase RecQ